MFLFGFGFTFVLHNVFYLYLDSYSQLFLVHVWHELIKYLFYLLMALMHHRVYKYLTIIFMLDCLCVFGFVFHLTNFIYIYSVIHLSKPLRNSCLT